MATKLSFIILLCFTMSSVFAQVPAKPIGAVSAHEKNELEKYQGNYISQETPDGIVIYLNGEKLMCKLPGQPSIVLEATSKNIFKSEKAGVSLEFISEGKKMIISQNNGTYTFAKV
jgi:D-alanyl-D-alanine carboxypeptidase